MSKPFLIAFGVAVLVTIAFVAWWGSAKHVEEGGKIGKVRLQKVDDAETIAVFDFNLRNDSARPRTVASVTARIDAADGSQIEGQTLGAADLTNVFRNYPALGDQYNSPLKALDTIAPKESLDREVGIRFDAPDAAIAGRKDVVLGIEYINGPLMELKAK